MAHRYRAYADLGFWENRPENPPPPKTLPPQFSQEEWLMYKSAKYDIAGSPQTLAVVHKPSGRRYMLMGEDDGEYWALLVFKDDELEPCRDMSGCQDVEGYGA